MPPAVTTSSPFASPDISACVFFASLALRPPQQEVEDADESDKQQQVHVPGTGRRAGFGRIRSGFK